MAGPTRIGGYTDYSSSTAVEYIPEVWSGKLVEKFYATTVFGEVCSTDYEGEIKGYGDNIIIRTIPDVTVSDYSIGSTFAQTDYQAPSSNAVEMPINKAKKFLVKVNTVDRAQSDLDMVEIFANEASMKLKIAIDQDVLQNVGASAASTNTGTTAGAISGNLNLGTTGAPVTFSTSTAVAYLVALGQAMDEQNIGDEGRWVVLPAWAVAKLKQSDLKTASLTGDSVSPLRNGKVGMVDRLTIYQSNLLDQTAGRTSIVAGHSAGLAFAAQITEMERLQNPWDFGHLQRGLCVYGYKVIEPKFIFNGFIVTG
jgi:hypothetical protein